MTELRPTIQAETQRLLEQAITGTPLGPSTALLERHRVYVRRFVELRLDCSCGLRVDPSSTWSRRTHMECGSCQLDSATSKMAPMPLDSGCGRSPRTTC